MPVRGLRMLWDVSTPLYPPAAWFEHPGEIPTDRRVTITADGRVYGYIALWDTCHIGIDGCQPPPKGSPTDYAFAHSGQTQTAEGSVIATANIGGDIGHPDLSKSAEYARQHYAGQLQDAHGKTVSQLMRVRYGEDEKGLYFAGALWPDVNEVQRAQLLASPLSGDWRWVGSWRNTEGGRDFVGACLVNIPGFGMKSTGDVNSYAGSMENIAASAAGEFYTVDGIDGEALTAATTRTSLPLADEGMHWDGDGAKARVRNWASSDGSGDASMVDWSKYGQAFAWHDASRPSEFGSYKLPYADVLQGTLTAIPRGVFAAAGAVSGARGGVDIPSQDLPAVKALLGSYYKKLKREAPWAMSANAHTECSCQKQDEPVIAAAAEEVDPNEVLNMKLDNLTSMVASLHEQMLEHKAHKLASQIVE